MTNIQPINPVSLFYWSWKVKVLVIFYIVSFTAAAAVSVPYSNPGPVSQWQAPVQSSHENVGARVILPFLLKGLLTFSEIEPSEQNHSFIVNVSESTGHSNPKIKEEETPYVVIEKISRLADKPGTSGFMMTEKMFSNKRRSPSSEESGDKQDTNTGQDMQVDEPQNKAAKSHPPDPDIPKQEQSEQVSVKPVTMIKDSLVESIETTLLENHTASDLARLKELKTNIEQESLTDKEITLHEEITAGLTQLHTENLDAFEHLTDLPDAEIVDSLILLHKAGFAINSDIIILKEALKFVSGLSIFLQKKKDSWPKTPDVYHVALMTTYILKYWYDRGEKDKEDENIDINECYSLFWITGLIIGRAPKSLSSDFRYSMDFDTATLFHRQLNCGLGNFEWIYYEVLTKAITKQFDRLTDDELESIGSNLEQYIAKSFPFDGLVRGVHDTYKASCIFLLDYPSKKPGE